MVRTRAALEAAWDFCEAYNIDRKDGRAAIFYEEHGVVTIEIFQLEEGSEL
jgi:hypothetical protein